MYIYHYELLADAEAWQDAFHRMYAVITSQLRRDAARLGVDWHEPDADEQEKIREAITTLIGPIPAE